jgi:hypothetical protein
MATVKESIYFTTHLGFLILRLCSEQVSQFGLNPDFAVEREVMIEEQTFRSEDKAFLPWRRQ